MIEPNCDMPWEIYLDWLQDQDNEDLRGIDLSFLTTGEFSITTIYTSEDVGTGDFTTGYLIPYERQTNPTGFGESTWFGNVCGGGYHDVEHGLSHGHGLYYDTELYD